ncbi:MAG: ArsR/SmtB family transcription factor [Candidatus Hodarchaeales archaeon]|jgi:ArsR family transcriptional regulator
MSNKLDPSSSETEMAALMLQAELCQSLTHPFRLKILQLLSNGKKNVSQILEETQKPQPFISQHLRVLREKKVVMTEREGNEVYYSLSDPKIEKICALVAELIKNQD